MFSEFKPLGHAIQHVLSVFSKGFLTTKRFLRGNWLEGFHFLFSIRDISVSVNIMGHIVCLRKYAHVSAILSDLYHIRAYNVQYSKPRVFDFDKNVRSCMFSVFSINCVILYMQFLSSFSIKLCPAATNRESHCYHLFI